jgi:hypothetical protein
VIARFRLRVMHRQQRRGRRGACPPRCWLGARAAIVDSDVHRGTAPELISVCYYQNPILLGWIAAWAAGQAVPGYKIPRKRQIPVARDHPTERRHFPDRPGAAGKAVRFKPAAAEPALGAACVQVITRASYER